MTEMLTELVKVNQAKQGDNIAFLRVFPAETHLVPNPELPLGLNPRQMFLQTLNALNELVHERMFKLFELCGCPLKNNLRLMDGEDTV